MQRCVPEVHWNVCMQIDATEQETWDKSLWKNGLGGDDIKHLSLSQSSADYRKTVKAWNFAFLLPPPIFQFLWFHCMVQRPFCRVIQKLKTLNDLQHICKASWKQVHKCFVSLQMICVKKIGYVGTCFMHCLNWIMVQTIV